MCGFFVGFLKSEPVQNRLYKSLKIWSMYADLEESLGTFDVRTSKFCRFSLHITYLLYSQTTKAVYNRIIDLKIATPQIVINFGSFLEEHHYFEEAFKVISSIHFPLHGCKFYKIYIFSLNRPTREVLLCSSGLTLMNCGTLTSPNS